MQWHIVQLYYIITIVCRETMQIIRFVQICRKKITHPEASHKRGVKATAKTSELQSESHNRAQGGGIQGGEGGG